MARPSLFNLRRLAASGDFFATCELADRLLDSPKPSDRREAVRLLQRPAELGSDWARFVLGFCYDQGIGTRKNPSLAARWYARAAAQDFPSAQLNLGLLYAHGRGVPQNYRRAIHLYKQAARHLASLSPQR